MILSVIDPETTETGARRAEWSARAGAFCVDVLLGLAVLACLLLVGWSAPHGGWLWWLCMIGSAGVLLIVSANRLLLPAATGWSLGRSLFGIRVVHLDGAMPGPWRLLLRDAAHLLDTVPLFLGWMWPLIDSRRRTFADVLAGTEVRYVEGDEPDRRRQAAIAFASAAGVAALAATLGYLTVYREQLAAAETRGQIAVQGPKIVADMLSYKATSVQEDFSHDQTLVSDSYRGELTKQQEAVRKAGPVDNEYWVTNSAVLSASSSRAGMLLLLQGQRGTAPKQRFITASVRVDFVRSGGDWLVDNLTVLTPPTAPESPVQPEKPGPAQPEPAKPAPTKPVPTKPAGPASTGGGR